MPRPENHLEVLTCGWSDHVLVGTDASEVTDEDQLLVRQYGGARWYRCLRCDSWITAAPPETPSRDKVPGRDEIELPMRGPLLRDRYVLRLIAIERSIHVLVLGLLAVAIFIFVGKRSELRHLYTRVMSALTSGSQSSSSHSLLGKMGHLFTYNPKDLWVAGVIVAIYAALEAIEMVGLWRARRWAEYLTFVATIIFVPAEIYEIVSKVTFLRSLTLVLNLAVAGYLLFGKRLFGTRGGYRAEHARRLEEGGWKAIERATPAYESSGSEKSTAG
jgi:uncharacterized membrane protein (DUF2068 family)